MYSRYIIAVINGFLILKVVTSVRIMPRIIDGEDAPIDKFPYTVSLRDSATHQHFCGGALISAKHVLSAGHCVNNRKFLPHKMYVALGVWNRFDQGTRKNVRRILLHPGFNSEIMQNDIAILVFYSKITFTKHIQPVALPQSNVPENGLLLAIISGWGQIVSLFFAFGFENV